MVTSAVHPNALAVVIAISLIFSFISFTTESLYVLTVPIMRPSSGKTLSVKPLLKAVIERIKYSFESIPRDYIVCRALIMAAPAETTSLSIRGTAPCPP